jgi:hypothetical protein
MKSMGEGIFDTEAFREGAKEVGPAFEGSILVGERPDEGDTVAKIRIGIQAAIKGRIRTVDEAEKYIRKELSL